MNFTDGYIQLQKQNWLQLLFVVNRVTTFQTTSNSSDFSSGDSISTLLSTYISMTISSIQLVVSHVSRKTTTSAKTGYFVRLSAKKKPRKYQKIFQFLLALIMAALCGRCGHYIFALWFLLLFSLPNLSGRRVDVYHTSTHVALVRI